MALKAGFKLTDIGPIPDDWNVARLGDIASVTAGGTPSRSVAEYWDGDIPWVTTSDIASRRITETQQFISRKGLDSSAAKLLPAGTLLMALYGQGKTRGKVAVLEIDAATNQACAAISVLRAVSNNFLFHFLGSRYEQIRSLSNTGNQENLNGTLVRSIPILLPERSEQASIAEALSDADALIETLERFLAKKRHIKQGALQALLTGRMRLRGFLQPWVRAKFGDVASPRQDRAEPFATNTFSVELEDIEQGTGRICAPAERPASVSLKTSFRPGDVLFGKLRAYLRKYWLADRPGVCSTEIWALVAKPRVLQRYLLQVVQLTTFIDAAGTSYGTHMPRSDWHVVKNYELLLPPRPEQEAIADLLGALDEEILAIDHHRAKLHRIREGMMQQLLTGRIRLVDANLTEDLQLVHSA